MSKQKVLLALSLLLNAGLIAFLATPAGSVLMRPQASVAIVPLAESRAPATGQSDVSPDANAGAPLAPAATTSRGDWTGDVRELVAELRRRGVDEGTVRRLGVAQAERLYRLAARALLQRPEPEEYWRVSDEARSFGRRGNDAAKMREFQRLRRARIEMLDELFGDVEAEATEFNTVNHFSWTSRDALFSYAPPDKRLAVTEFFERVAIGAGQTPVQRLVSQQLYTPAQEVAHDDELKKILGAELFEDYLRRSSATASRLKYDLAAFEPSRAEFDALLRVEREHAPQTAEPVGPYDAQQYERTQAPRREAIKEALGDARYTDYERATDQSFRHLDALARELGLGAGTARAAFEHVERTRKQVLALGGDRLDMADPKVRDALAAARRDLQARLAQELGLQSLSGNEQQMVLGQALNVYPNQVARRVFGWF